MSHGRHAALPDGLLFAGPGPGAVVPGHTLCSKKQNVRLILDKYICRAKQGVFVQVSKNERPLEISEELLSECLTGEPHEQIITQH
jgi:hypothetical protein